MTDAPPPSETKPGWAFHRPQPWAVVALIVSALFVWQWMENRLQLAETREEVARRLAEADAASSEERGALKQAREQMEALQAKVGALEAKQEEFQGQTAALQGLYQDLSRSRDEAAVLEAEQAVTLAGQQLQLAGNVQAAVLALQAADAKLARLDRPQFMALRKALARDLERLRVLPFVDVPGMSLKLESVLMAADKLPLALTGRLPSPKSRAPASEVPRPWWQAAAGEFWQEVKGLVRVQRFDREEPVLLAPGQSFFLRENLKLRLLNARLALLSRDQGSFRNELKTAQDWLGRHFDAHDKGVQAAQATLRQLASTDLVIEVPTLNDSLAALRSAHNGKGGK